MKKLPPDSPVETLLVRISGRVQGVGYRASTVRQAHQLGVHGWVRNLDDGAVQALVQGPVDRVDAMLSWFHLGPAQAQVREVTHEVIVSERRFDRFEQL
ncbi:MAG: acylphosphatase [Burkholderiaceae bacterium]